MKKTTVGIICAGDDELAPFLPMITDCSISEKAMLKFYSGKIAGAVSDNSKVLDTVVSTETAYHDVNKDILTDFHPWLSSVWIKSDAFLTELAKISAKKLSSDFNIVFGKTVMGELLLTEKKNRVSQKYSIR